MKRDGINYPKFKAQFALMDFEAVDDPLLMRRFEGLGPQEMPSYLYGHSVVLRASSRHLQPERSVGRDARPTRDVTRVPLPLSLARLPQRATIPHTP